MRVLVIPVTLLSVAVAGPAGAENVPTARSGTESTYPSAFAGYRSFKNEPIKAWIASNDEMRRLGGHLGHANESPAHSDALPADREAQTTTKPATGSKP